MSMKANKSEQDIHKVANEYWFIKCYSLWDTCSRESGVSDCSL